VVAKGEGWQRAREAFSMLLGELSQASMFSLAYVSGEYTSRDHRAEKAQQPPMKPIDLAKQREAIHLLQDEILSDKAFQFKPELLRHLAPQHWRDRDFWFFFEPYQYPLLQRVLSIQRLVVSQLLDPNHLRSLQENALQVEPGQEALQMSEVFQALTDSIWSELPASDAELKKDAKVALSTIRRNLQREHVAHLSRLVVGPKRQQWMSLMYLIFFGDERPAPADARSLARMHLRQIDARIQRVVGGQAKNVQLDAQSRAHLEELHDQIDRVLKASLQMNDL